jgi:hypothetical protein
MALNGKIKGVKAGGDGRMIGGAIFDKNGISYEFTQIYSTELSLQDGDAVRFDVVNIDGKAIANNVIRRTVGTIESINLDNSSGYIIEKELNPKRFGSDGKPNMIRFYQPHLRELGISVNDIVHYDLVNDLKGETIAVNVSEN